MRKILLSAMLIAVVGGGAIAATRAYFTSQNVLGQSTVASGRLTLDLNGAETKIVNLGDLINWAPGDESKTTAEIVVENVGTLDFAWVGKFVLSGDSQLPKVVYIKEMQMEFLKPDGTTWEPTDKFITNGKGSGLYPTEYNRLATLDPLGVISLDTWVKNYVGMIPPYPYFEGALKPGYKYKLTFKLAMHPSAGNTYQNRSMGLGFQANATQINADALSELLGSLGTAHPPSGFDIPWLNAQISKQP